MARKVELLCPAGDMEKLQMAVLYGADAVYLAGTSFGMRSFTGNFTPEELPKAIQFAHEHGVRVHVTVNTMPRNDEAAALPAWLEQLDADSRGPRRVCDGREVRPALRAAHFNPAVDCKLRLRAELVRPWREAGRSGAGAESCGNYHDPRKGFSRAGA